MAQFKPGESGNAGGRPKAKELRALCRTFTEKAVNRLAEFLDHDNPTVVMKAAVELLNRAWGTPPASVAVEVEDSRVVGGQAMPAPEVLERLGEIIAETEREMGLAIMEGATNAERVRRILETPGHLPPSFYRAVRQGSGTLQ